MNIKKIIMNCALFNVLMLQAEESFVSQVDEESFQREVLEEKDRMVIVKVSATWCPPCQKAAPIIERVASKLQEIKFVSIDYDQNLKFIEQHNIQSVPCFLIYDQGKCENMFAGCPPDEGVVEEMFKFLLEYWKQIHNK